MEPLKGDWLNGRPPITLTVIFVSSKSFFFKLITLYFEQEELT